MSRSQLAKLSAQYSLGAGLESRYFEYSTDQDQDCQDCCKYHVTEEPFSHFCFMMTSTFKTNGFVCHPNHCQYIYFSTQYPAKSFQEILDWEIRNKSRISIQVHAILAVNSINTT